MSDVKREIRNLEKEYKKLQEEAFRLSKSNRMQSDLKAAEAHEVLRKIERLEREI